MSYITVLIVGVNEMISIHNFFILPLKAMENSKTSDQINTVQ